MSIRNVLAISIAGLLSLTLLATSGLIVFSRRLQQQLRVWVSSGAGIQAAEEIELDLLRLNRLHTTAESSIVPDIRQERRQLEQDLSRRLAETRSAAETQRERDIATRASDAVTAYVNSQDADGLGERRLHAAIDVLGELIAFNVAEAEVADVQLARWNRLADAGAAAGGLLLLIGVLGTFAWLRSAAFTPLFDLRSAIDKVSAGEVTARAPETGPDEIADIARAFNAMADRLAAEGERQMTFLSGVAHDLRAPLTPLKIAAEMGRQPEVLSDSGYVTRILDVVTRQVDHLERMAEDLLDAVRIEGGRLQLRTETCDLRPIVSGMADLFGPQSRAHRIEVHVPDSAVTVSCDPVRIQQVLTNLVGNAIKYSPEGGLVALTISVHGPQACVAVADDGIGMSERDLARLFEPFSRAPAVQSRIPGLGLGLSISRQIVQMHGGRIEVRSRLGSGSTFTIWLPLAGAPLPHVEAEVG